MASTLEEISVPTNISSKNTIRLSGREPSSCSPEEICFAVIYDSFCAGSPLISLLIIFAAALIRLIFSLSSLSVLSK